jgi:hypothetical protein
MIDAGAPVFEPGQSVDPARAEALALLYELPLQFAEVTELDTLFQTIIERLVTIIPAASRGALLLEDAESRELLLKAHVPVGRPSVSVTWPRRRWRHARGLSGTRARIPVKARFLTASGPACMCR